MSVPWQPHRATLAALGHAEEVLGSKVVMSRGFCRGLVPLELSSLVMCMHPILCVLGLSWLLFHCCDT